MSRTTKLSFLSLFVAVTLAAPSALSLKPIGGIGTMPPIVIGPVIDNGYPTKPAYPTVSVQDPRSPSMSVTVGWYNTSVASSATLYRSTNSGVYTAVSSGTNYTKSTTSTLRDLAPPIDQQACYVVTVFNNGGSATSDPVCMLLPDGRNRPLWRAQLRVGVATVSDAGTDADVAVRLNSPINIGYYPNGNETWVDTPRDDFEGGSLRTYELLTKKLGGDVSDVKMVSMLIGGDDAMCVRTVELILNEQSVFFRDFGNSTCRWVSQSNMLTITREELRASSTWQAMPTVARPAIVSYPLMDSLATATVGNALHGRDVGFRDSSPSPQNTNTSGSRRVYEWPMEYYSLPLMMQAELLTDTTCEAGTAKGHVFVGAVDADAAGWLWIVKPISEALVEAFEPTFPSLFSETVDMGPCSLDLHLCFTGNGLQPQLGQCAPNG